MATLRLVKVAVQPFFVLDDGENITELEHPTTVIPAAEWPSYSAERFPREVAEWQAQIDAEAQGTAEKPKPNRELRRTKRPRGKAL